MMAARDDPPAASTVKPPPRKPNCEQMVVAIAAAALPASVCPVTGGNGARYRAAAVASTWCPTWGATPDVARASARTRRVYEIGRHTSELQSRPHLVCR